MKSVDSEGKMMTKRMLWRSGSALAVLGALLLSACASNGGSANNNAQDEGKQASKPVKLLTESQITGELKSGKAMIISPLLNSIPIWRKLGGTDHVFFPQGGHEETDEVIGNFGVIFVTPGTYFLSGRMLQTNKDLSVVKASVKKESPSALGKVVYSSALKSIYFLPTESTQPTKINYASVNVKAGEIVLIDGVNFDKYQDDQTQCAETRTEKGTTIACPLTKLTLWHGPYQNAFQLPDLKAAAKKAGFSQELINRIEGRSITLGDWVLPKPITTFEDSTKIYAIEPKSTKGKTTKPQKSRR